MPLARRAKPIFRQETVYVVAQVAGAPPMMEVFQFGKSHDRLPGNVVMGGPYGDRLGDLFTIAAPCRG